MTALPPLTFGLFTVALTATAGIALFTGVQFAVISLWRRREATNLAYAAVCLCIAALALANAVLDAAGGLTLAVQAVRAMIAASIIYFVPFVIFIGAYTGERAPRWLVAATVLLAVLFSWLNLRGADPLLFAGLRAGQALELPWGERLFTLVGQPTAWGSVFHVLTYAAFGWAMLRTVRQYRHGERARAGLLGLCLASQFAALLWGDVVIDLVGVHAPYLDSFAFLPFVLLMGTSLAVARVQAERALGESEHRYRTLFEEIDEGSCILERVDGTATGDTDFRFVAANPAFAVHTGAIGVVGRTVAEMFPALAAHWTGVFERVLATGEPSRFEHASDGFERVLDHYACRLRDAGRRRIALVIRDVTARKRYDARQRLLLNELNHRVKNTLATVQSIAMQSLRDAPDPERAYDDFEGRLLALSKIHDILTRESWVAASLGHVVQEALAPYRDAAGRRLRLGGPTVRLPPPLALAFALAMHELSTNAVKYGALSRPSGTIEVTWDIHLDPGGDQHLRLCWREAGGPAVSVPSRRGFGLRLLERGLAQEIGGRVEVAFAAAGLVCTIEAHLRPGVAEADQGALARGASG